MTEPARSDADYHPTKRLLAQGKPVPFAQLRELFDSLHTTELMHGLWLDQENRWRVREPILVEQYFEAFPVLRYDPERIAALIHGEIFLRRQRGDQPTLAEYQNRFPDQAERLARLFQPGQPPPALSWPDGLDVTATAPPAARDAAPPVPVVRGYEIVGQVGRGGMGVVYKARHLSLNRPVALKMILAGSLARPEQMAGFQREAELTARLQHPNIVQVFEVGVPPEHACAFLAMEFVEGCSLAQMIAGRPQDPSWAAQILETAARAVHEAHRQGIIHRDLKPANILLKGSLEPKIADFGLAHAMDGDSQITTTTASMGTPCYMAPEQAEGRGADIGPATDVFALGTILYEMLTGQPPWRGTSAWETLEQVRLLEAIPPTRTQKSTPRDLETICLKCLEKAPGSRYPSAAALADDLRRFRHGEPITARPVGALERGARWCRRNPGWAGMFTTTALLLLVLTVGAVATSMRLEAELTSTRAEKARAEKAEQDSREESARAIRARRLAEVNQWEALTAQAAALRTSDTPGQRFASLRLLKTALDLGRALQLAPDKIDALRNQWVLRSALPDLHAVLTWTGFPPGSVAVDFDSNLETYARLDAQGSCSLRRVAGDLELFRLPAPPEGNTGPDDFLQLSPDARHIALRFTSGRLQVYTADPKGARLLVSARAVHSLDFGRAGQGLVVGHKDGALSWYDLATGKLKSEVPPKGFVEANVAMHPTEPHAVVWSAKKQNAEVCDLRDGKSLRFLPAHVPFGDIAWLPDGTTVVAALGSTVLLEKLGPQYSQARELGAGLELASLAISPNGDLLAARGVKGELHLIKLSTGETLFKMAPTLMPLRRLRFGSDGTRLAAGALKELLVLWQVADGKEQRRLAVRLPTRYRSLALSPQLPRLLAVSMEDGLGFWDLETGQELAAALVPGIARVEFEPSGSLLTCGMAGVFRWPVRMVESELLIGPRQPLKQLHAASDLALSRDGKVLAAGAGLKKPLAGGVRVLTLEMGKAPEELDSGLAVQGLALSPDAQWLAWGLEAATKLKVWDLRANKLAHEWSASAVPCFSPDASWLALGAENGRLFQVGTWKPGPAFSGLAAFTQDSKTLAVETGSGEIRLLDVAGGRETGRLSDPSAAVAEKLLFSPEDARLLTLSNGSLPGIRVWDLRLVRANLAAVGLDWDVPGLSPSRSTPPLPPVRIEIGK